MIPSVNMVEHIINNYNQIGLFSRYMGIPIDDINYCLENTSNKIHNPLREDYDPSLGFMYKHSNSKLQCKDWGDDSYSGDIFDMIALLSGLNSNESIDFVKIFKLIVNNNDINTKVKSDIISRINNKSFKDIRYVSRQFISDDITFWTNGGVDINHLKFRNIYPVEHLWIDDMNFPIYTSKPSNPVYSYHLGRDKQSREIVKTYAPRDKELKFRTNNKIVFEALGELYNARVLIITKSRKDKVAIECMLMDDDKPVSTLAHTLQSILALSKDIDDCMTYCVTSFNSESYRIKPDLAKYLKSIYDIIIINTDYDKQGILNSFYHNVLYGFHSVFLGNNKLSIDEFKDKELNRYFNKIHLIDNKVTLFRGRFYDFINENRDSHIYKDIFDYTTNNGIEKGTKLVNNLFNVKQFNT